MAPATSHLRRQQQPSNLAGTDGDTNIPSQPKTAGEVQKPGTNDTKKVIGHPASQAGSTDLSGNNAVTDQLGNVSPPPAPVLLEANTALVSGTLLLSEPPAIMAAAVTAKTDPTRAPQIPSPVMVNAQPGSKAKISVDKMGLQPVSKPVEASVAASTTESLLKTSGSPASIPQVSPVVQKDPAIAAVSDKTLAEDPD